MAYSRETSIKSINELAKVVSQDKFAAVVADLREAETSGPSDQEKIGMLERAKKELQGFPGKPRDNTARERDGKDHASQFDHGVCV